MADLTLERCLPSACAAEIQALFTRAGQPEFSSVFDRVYRVREKLGMRSWVARENNDVVLHISAAPEPFSHGSRTVKGALLADLMADPTHRDFWGPIKLARKMVSDIRAEGATDFIATSYLPAAEGVFRAAGFKQFAVVRRHVMPLIWPYPLVRRLLLRQRVPRLTAVPFRDGRSEIDLSDLASPGCFRPLATPEYFGTRMPRLEYPSGTWLLAGEAASPDAVVLVSPKPTELIIADVLWRDENVSLAGVLASVSRWAARSGNRRLTITTMEQSRLGEAARRAGFLPRPETYTLLLLPISAPAVIPPPERWCFTPFVLTAW